MHNFFFNFTSCLFDKQFVCCVCRNETAARITPFVFLCVSSCPCLRLLLPHILVILSPSLTKLLIPTVVCVLLPQERHKVFFLTMAGILRGIVTVSHNFL